MSSTIHSLRRGILMLALVTTGAVLSACLRGPSPVEIALSQAEQDLMQGHPESAVDSLRDLRPQGTASERASVRPVIAGLLKRARAACTVKAHDTFMRGLTLAQKGDPFAAQDLFTEAERFSGEDYGADRALCEQIIRAQDGPTMSRVHLARTMDDVTMRINAWLALHNYYAYQADWEGFWSGQHSQMILDSFSQLEHALASRTDSSGAGRAVTQLATKRLADLRQSFIVWKKAANRSSAGDSAGTAGMVVGEFLKSHVMLRDVLRGSVAIDAWVLKNFWGMNAPAASSKFR